jgi:CDP-6-deoxy-D-xylo-4-hexulose-3-dehydrase
LINNPRLKMIGKNFRDWGRHFYLEPGNDNICNKRFEWQLRELPNGYDLNYTYSHIGFNLRVTDMQAAVGFSQLEKTDALVIKRRENYKLLYANMKEFDEYFVLPEPNTNSDPNWFGFLLTVGDRVKVNRHELVQELEQNKIGTRLLFVSNLMRQPVYANIEKRTVRTFKYTDKVMKDSSWVGVWPRLNKEHCDYIVDIPKK